MTRTRVMAADAGFTIVELMVALSLFALLSLAGVALLRTSIDTQTSVAARLTDSGSIERLRALIGAELAAAQPRVGRDATGLRAPALTGSGDAIRFTYASDDSDGRSGVTTVRYAVIGTDMVRGADGQAATATLMRDVDSARFRFRDAAGGWTDAWGGAPGDATLPRAVELTLTPATGAPLVMRFLVAPDTPGTPPAEEAQAADAAPDGPPA